ncbi:chromatin binding protein [Coemansia sp. RSA 1933]|nr:chromatin binding protein [Coemansia sp. RSA 1933]
MNRKLLDPFEPEYPEEIEACLDDEYAVRCAFSHHGSFLATARSDGRCYIWDMDTLNIMRRLHHGDAPLVGLSWSRSSRYILTYDDAGVCILWDLQSSGSIRTRVAFDSPVVCARIHPRCCTQFIVCLARAAPCLVSAGPTAQDDPAIERLRIAGDDVDLASKAAASTCCCFGKKGVYAFFGTSRGLVLALHVATRTIACSAKLSASAVNTIACNPRGSDIVTSSTDRILRVCRSHLPADQTKTDPPSIVLTTKIQDTVNRVHWAQAVFSSSGDYIVSGIQHKAEHNIYIWDKVSGSLVKMLTGPNELLEDCAVHPLRPIYVSVSTFGIIYLWTRIPQQNWNAFAPGFRELEENIDYLEPEDAFDRTVQTSDGTIVDCAHERSLRDCLAASATVDPADMDAVVDITDNDPLFSDSDSEEEDFLLPVSIDNDEVVPGAIRRAFSTLPQPLLKQHVATPTDHLAASVLRPIGSNRRVAPSAGEVGPLNWPPPQSVRAISPLPETIQAWLMDFETNDPVEIIDVQRTVFAAPIRTDIMHRAVTYERNMRRQGTHSARNRSQVRGSSRKSQPQKGLGMARHGSRRAPQFVGGGKAHGPVPRSHETEIQRKVWLMALRSALSLKFAQDQLVIVDDLCLKSEKTHDLVHILKANGWCPLTNRTESPSVVFLPHMETEDSMDHRHLSMASRNIPGVSIMPAHDAEVYEILRHDYLILDRKALDLLQGILKPM